MPYHAFAYGTGSQQGPGAWHGLARHLNWTPHQHTRLWPSGDVHAPSTHPWTLFLLVVHHDAVGQGVQGVVFAQVGVGAGVPLRLRVRCVQRHGGWHLLPERVVAANALALKPGPEAFLPTPENPAYRITYPLLPCCTHRGASLADDDASRLHRLATEYLDAPRL